MVTANSSAELQYGPRLGNAYQMVNAKWRYNPNVHCMGGNWEVEAIDDSVYQQARPSSSDPRRSLHARP